MLPAKTLTFPQSYAILNVHQSNYEILRPPETRGNDQGSKKAWAINIEVPQSLLTIKPGAGVCYSRERTGGSVMTKKAARTGKDLERRVADAYREMRAREVKHDVELAGNQIDVYVELETPGRLRRRIAVEAKDWTSPVGIDTVNGFAHIVDLLHRERLIDEGIIVSAAGFSKQARNAARTHGIQLLEPAALDAMVEEAKAAERTLPTYTPPPPPDPATLPEPRPLPPGSRLLFHRNALFTGRAELLKALAHTLLHVQAPSTIVTQAVHGMRGVGKTQLAVEFAYRYGRFFHGVHWLNADPPDALVASHNPRQWPRR